MNFSLPFEEHPSTFEERCFQIRPKSYKTNCDNKFHARNFVIAMYSKYSPISNSLVAVNVFIYNILMLVFIFK